jgi:hypothetical protein
MFKISHVREVPTITGLPSEVIGVVEGIVSILDRVYGADRDPLNDDGGYAVILEPQDDLSVLEDVDLDVESLQPEHTDIIKTSIGIEYIHALILCNNEFSIHILCEKDKASINLLDC